MRRPLPLILAIVVASSGCALNFDQFVDGSIAPVDAVAFEGGQDTNPSTDCPYPWILLGVAGDTSSTLQRYSFTATGATRCTDFAGMPANLDLFASITPLRYAVVNSDDTWIVDATRPTAAQPVSHLADTIPTTVFTLYHATVPYVVVPYRSTGGGSSIPTIRVINVSSIPFDTRDWSPSTGTDGPMVSDPMIAMTLDPGAAGHVIAAFLTNTRANSIDIFGTANDVFRSSTAGFVNSARGVWGVGVGFGVGENNNLQFTLTDASRSTSMANASGPYLCRSACPFASRFEVLPDPTGAGAFTFCRLPDSLGRVFRWTQSTNQCQLLSEINDTGGGRLMSIEIVPSATRN